MSHGAEQILEGTGGSDYERYIRTDELLALQKGPEEWLHRDELLFTVTHQSSELWLKLAISEVNESLALLRAGRVQPALRLLARVRLCIGYATIQLDMLEQMTPWDYQQVRKALGHGSGFDSPGESPIPYSESCRSARVGAKSNTKQTGLRISSSFGSSPFGFLIDHGDCTRNAA